MIFFFNKIGDGHTGGPGWLGMEWPSSMSILLASGWLEWYLQASPGIFNNSCHCPHNNWNWPNNGEKDLSIQRQIDSLATHLINVTHFLKGYSISWNKGVFLDLFHLISCKKNIQTSIIPGNWRSPHNSHNLGSCLWLPMSI